MKIYKTSEELELMSPKELVEERKAMKARQQVLLEEARQYRDAKVNILAEMQMRINVLQIEEALAGEDRIDNDLSLHDWLCVVH